MRFVVPGIVVANIRRGLTSTRARPDELDQLWNAYQTSLIVACAMVEGATFFLLVSYMVEGQPLNLGAAVAMIVVLACHFPTAASAGRWLEAQLDQLRQERAFAASSANS
jgi:hypothetical protein